MAAGNILVVDDNKSMLSALDILLSTEYDHIQCISNPNLIMSELRKCKYHLVLLDMNFNAGLNTGNEGIFWLQQVKDNYPDISVVMITAYGDVELAVKALKAGASDFILKPWDNNKMLATISAAIQLSLSKSEIENLKLKQKELKKAAGRNEGMIIGSSPALIQVLKVVRKVAKTDTNILITGENGTGKELIAREIHNLSNRNQEIMVNVDMGAISESLFESELFGHVKGAFTDAYETRTGKFEVANNSTLFLDEIGNLSFHLQSKLLAAIQNREITKIGSNQVVPVNIRLICATNRNLFDLVETGLFREDLLYRINTIHVEMPPLREREDDILLLSDYFLKKYAWKYNKPSLRLNNYAQEKIRSYRWPGNVRELEHAIEKAVILSDKEILTAEDFLLKPMGDMGIDMGTFNLEEIEKRVIMQVLSKECNISLAAEQLGITRQTLYNKLKKYGLKINLL